MKVFSPQSALLVFSALTAFVPVTLQAQSQAAATPSQTPAPKSAPNAGTPKYTQEQMEEMINKLQDRIKKAADSVLGRIQKEEAGVRLKFSYFRKPERLDPNTYRSKEDVVAWRDSLQKFRDQENGLDKLYANAEQDLGNALVQQRINQAIADQIKNELLKSFPWGVIKRKSSLMRDFIAEHDDLLTFYDKNWGSWQPASEGSAPIFADPKLAAAFRALKDKINGTGAQIEDQYKMMMQ
jgi:hypothetical protein